MAAKWQEFGEPSKWCAGEWQLKHVRMHPGTSDRVVELMIVTQLKGLGGRRNNNAGRLQPVANYVMEKWRPVAMGTLDRRIATCHTTSQHSLTYKRH